MSQAMNPPKPLAPGCQIIFGAVRHARHTPVRHAFDYRSFQIRLPARLLDGPARGNWLFGIKRRALISVSDSEHGDEQGGTDWLRRLLSAQRIVADGDCWLHTFPRVFGYAFKPVSFWFCHRADGALIAVVAEVNNTYGDRHCYLLSHPDQRPIRDGETLRAQKKMHVSPFMDSSGEYRFRFANTDRRMLARIELANGEAGHLTTSISGVAKPLGSRAALWALIGYPAFTFGVIARIHWQALRLWFAGVPVHSRPTPPVANTVTRGHE